MNEVWVDIENYEGLYRISNLGNVESLQRITKGKHIRVVPYKRLALNKNKDGYVQVNLWKNNKLKRYKTSVLVATHFISNVDNKPQVNHIDGNKDNNRFDNLEWVTASENLKHAHRIGIKKQSPVAVKKLIQHNVEVKSKPINQYDLLGNYIETHKSISSASRKLKISPAQISRVCNGKRKTTKGMVFKFEKKFND